MTSGVVVRNLNKTYDTGQSRFQALQNLNVEIEPSDFVTIIGQSGCGKTTLIRCVAGLEGYDSGSISVGGREVAEPGPDRFMVFQEFDQLFPWLRVIDNVAQPRRHIRREDRDSSRRNALRFLEMVGLSGFETSYPHQLSGGMKQRVAIARALAVEPEVLLMDEPFGALDAITRNSVQEQLLGIWMKTRPTVLFVTHNIEEAILLSTRIVVLDKNPGRLKELIVNDLPYPRHPGNRKFGDLWERLFDSLGLQHTDAPGPMPRKGRRQKTR
ncbi:MAG: ABC transporter ATP-binding protein [Hyphomicrobiales bacterium]